MYGETASVMSYARPIMAASQHALMNMMRQAYQDEERSAPYQAMAENGGPTVAASNALSEVVANPGVQLEGVDPRLKALLDQAIGQYDGPGEWRYTEGVRTPERQRELYAQGRTAPGKIVTNTLNSAHLDGRALDLAYIRDGKAVWDIAPYNALNDIVQGLEGQHGVDVTWGGEWKSLVDGPHFQISR